MRGFLAWWELQGGFGVALSGFKWILGHGVRVLRAGLAGGVQQPSSRIAETCLGVSLQVDLVERQAGKLSWDIWGCRLSHVPNPSFALLLPSPPSESRQEGILGCCLCWEPLAMLHRQIQPSAFPAKRENVPPGLPRAGTRGARLSSQPCLGSALSPAHLFTLKSAAQGKLLNLRGCSQHSWRITGSWSGLGWDGL